MDPWMCDRHTLGLSRLRPTRRARSLVLAVAALAAAGAGRQRGALAAKRYRKQWRQAARGTWPPAVVGGRIVLRYSGGLFALRIADGKELWKTRIADVQRGPDALAAHGAHAYALSSNALYALRAKDGAIVGTRTLDHPRSVTANGGGVYVSYAKGVARFDARAANQPGGVTGVTGRIEGAHRGHVVLYRELKKSDGEGSPKRLTVVTLGSGKRYEFRLLPTGGHSLARVRGGKLSFIDYSLRHDGKNPRKLYYTEADYRRAKKLKDVSLASRYGDPKADRFDVAFDRASGVLFIGSRAASGSAPSTLRAYRPADNRILWQRSGALLSTPLLLHDGMLWSTVSSSNKTRLVAYALDDGKQRESHPLDGPAIGGVVGGGAGRVLVRTKRSLYSFGSAAGEIHSASKAPSGAGAKATRWKLYRDRRAGYTVKLPSSWRLLRGRIRRRSADRLSVPFVRYRWTHKHWKFVGSLHVLVRPAGKQNAEQVWKSVLAQRKATSGDAKVQRVARVRQAGHRAVLGAYSFRTKNGQLNRARSLCTVSHGLAFELRVRMLADAPAEIWTEVMSIFRTFHPDPGLRRKGR